MHTIYMVHLGARPKGRLIEQHDMFFGVGASLKALIPAINNHWPEVKNKWHIDSYRAVTKVAGYDGNAYHISWQQDDVDVSQVESANDAPLKLFFINLGGYQHGSTEEFHHKILVVAPTQALAIRYAKQSPFYQQYSYYDETSPLNAASHVDDKLQVDVDDIYQVDSLLPAGKMILELIEEESEGDEDNNHVGYLSLKALNKLGL